jgi:hypothetical protein
LQRGLNFFCGNTPFVGWGDGFEAVILT